MCKVRAPRFRVPKSLHYSSSSDPRSRPRHCVWTRRAPLGGGAAAAWACGVCGAAGGRWPDRNLPCGERAPLVLDLRAGAVPALCPSELRARLPPSRTAGSPGRLAAFRWRLVSQLQEQARAQKHTPPASPTPQPAQDRLPASPIYEVGVALQCARVSDSPGHPRQLGAPVDRGGGSPRRSAWPPSREGGPGRSPQCWGTRCMSSVSASAAPGWASCTRPPFLAQPAVPH